MCALVGDRDEGDLEYFWIAEHLLFHGAGLGAYVARPDLQIGPLALIGGSLLSAATGSHLVFASLVFALTLLLLTMRSLDGLIQDRGGDVARPQVALTFGGVALAASWAVVVPGWGHLDDLAALLALVAAVRAAARGEGLRTGLFLAVATDCKPWGLYAAALVVVVPGAGERLRALGALAVGIGVCWLPFVVGDPATLGALGRFQIPADAASLPYLLGYHATDPSWTRAAQLGLATVLVLLCARSGRWDLVLLCVAISRLLLDGGVYPYYDVELVLGALVADLAAAGRSSSTYVPYLPTALLAWVGMEVTHQVADATAALGVRCAVYAILLGAAVVRGRAAASAQVAYDGIPAPMALNSDVLTADT